MKTLIHITKLFAKGFGILAAVFAAVYGLGFTIDWTAVHVLHLGAPLSHKADVFLCGLAATGIIGFCVMVGAAFNAKGGTGYGS